MLSDNYISYIATVKRYSARTVEIYSDVLREFIAESCETADDEHILKALSPTGMRNYEMYLLGTKKYSSRTVGLHISVLSGFSKYLMKEGLITTNAARVVKRPKLEKRLPVVYREDALKEYFSSTEPFSNEENLSLLTGDDKASLSLYGKRRNRLIISILVGTGVRRAELIGLNVSSVDFARKQLLVKGKGDKMREIPLVGALCTEISLYLQATVLVTGMEKEPDDPLIEKPGGGRLYPVLVDRIVKKELGNVESITGRKSPHVLRHTLATELLDDGADLNSIKELLGHSSLAATQVYTHNSAEKLKRVYMNAHPRAKKENENGS